jgi:hypothetical protein
LAPSPGLPKVHLHNPALAYETGDERDWSPRLRMPRLQRSTTCSTNFWKGRCCHELRSKETAAGDGIRRCRMSIGWLIPGIGLGVLVAVTIAPNLKDIQRYIKISSM